MLLQLISLLLLLHGYTLALANPSSIVSKHRSVSSSIGSTTIIPPDTDTTLKVAEVGGKLYIQQKNRFIELFMNGEKLSVSGGKGRLATTTTHYDGIFGIYELPMGNYITLITDTSKATDVPFDDVYRIDKIEFVRIPDIDQMSRRVSLSLQEKQKYAESLMMNIFSRHSFYFSNGTYDITRSLQYNTLSHNSNFSNWRNCDERFFWNLNSLKPLIEAQAESFILPVTNAWISSADVDINGKNHQFSLISRRSRRRQGPR